jgi:hypothetical protein
MSGIFQSHHKAPHEKSAPSMISAQNPKASKAAKSAYHSAKVHPCIVVFLIVFSETEDKTIRTPLFPSHRCADVVLEELVVAVAVRIVPGNLVTLIKRYSSEEMP